MYIVVLSVLSLGYMWVSDFSIKKGRNKEEFKFAL